MSDLTAVLADANPVMIFVVGLMVLFGLIAIPVYIVGAIVDLVRFLRGTEECGWGCWYNRNDPPIGWCARRRGHFGEHIWSGDVQKLRKLA